MAPRTILLLALVALPGCVQAPADANDVDTTATEEADALAPARLDWRGHVLASPTDALMHSQPTESLLWPYEQAGIVVAMPEGVSAIEIAVAWTGPGEFGIHLHSHNKDHEYIGHRSTAAQWTENPHCIRVPADDLAPGDWMVMIHSTDAVQTDFTMSVLTQGGAAILVEDERHGHDRVDDALYGDAREEHEPEACALWTAEGKPEAG